MRVINKKNVLEKIGVFCTSETTLQTICASINLPLTDITKIKKPKYNILDTVLSIKTRALIAIGLECDVNLDGVPGVTPKVLYDFFQSEKKHEGSCTYDQLLNMYIYKKEKKEKRNMDVSEKCEYKIYLNVLVESFLYEPANIKGNAHEKNMYVPRVYPHLLHPYNESFARNDSTITVNTVDCLFDSFYCAGPGTGKHMVLNGEGSKRSCLTCSQDICKTCTMERNGSTTTSEILYFCVKCYAEESSFPNINVLTSTNVSRQEMMHYLASVGSQVRSTDSIADIQDLYEALYRNNNATYNETILNKITVPAESATYLDNINPLLPFNVCDGGRFICNEVLTTSEKIELVELFGELVKIERNDQNYSSNNQTYSVVPSIIRRFSEMARVHSGFRLCKRACRHALDPKAHDIFTCKGEIIKYKNKTGLVLKHHVNASMKQVKYDVILAFTKDTIIACSCSCKAGSTTNEKVVCVHILPVLMQMSQLMFKAMAEHMLVEFTNYYKRGTTILTQEQKQNLLSTLRILYLADRGSLHDCPDSINEITSLYDVGTEKIKFNQMQTEPDFATVLGPLRSLDLSSAISKAKKTINNNALETNGNENIQSTNIENIQPIERINYHKICECIDALIFVLRRQSNSEAFEHLIGFKLAEHRTQIKFFGTPRPNEYVKKRWRQVLELANIQQPKKNEYKQFRNIALTYNRRRTLNRRTFRHQHRRASYKETKQGMFGMWNVSAYRC